MEYREINLVANVAMHVPTTGRFLRVVDASGRIEIDSDTGIKTDYLAGLGGNFSDPETGEPFHRITFKSPVTQTIAILTSAYPIDDNRQTGAVTVDPDGGFSGMAAITAAAANEQNTVAANSLRRKIYIRGGEANTGNVWAGGTAADEGLPLGPDDVFYEAISGEIDLFFEDSGDKVYLGEVL